MKLKRLFLIVIPVVILICILLSNVFGEKLLYVQNYNLNRIDVSDESILIEGGFGGASGIGQDGYDYYVKNDCLYLKIYQQNALFTSKPLNGSINIELNGDFSKLKGIYLVQPKGDPINIWP